MRDLGSASANACLGALLIMGGASLSDFSISPFSAKLSQTAALLRDRLADESRVISGSRPQSAAPKEGEQSVAPSSVPQCPHLPGWELPRTDPW